MGMTDMHIGIVAIAYNRPQGLQRLLDSLQRVSVPPGCTAQLIISIDHAADEAVRHAVYAVADEFIWQGGETSVVKHSAQLGLKDHVLRAGDMVADFDALIMLEDDLTVAPGTVAYAYQAVQQYVDDASIAGFSLYSYRINEYAHLPFMPLHDGFDNYFMQSASSWGQFWTPTQWHAFRTWLEDHPTVTHQRVPQRVQEWSDQSWKKHFIEYLIATNSYVVYPRVSLSTNFGDPGAHFPIGTGQFQTPLQLGTPSYRFSSLQESTSAYDAHYELTPAALAKTSSVAQELVHTYNVELDLYGTKTVETIAADYVITSQTVATSLQTFGCAYIPLEANIVFGQSGEVFSLAKKTDLTGVSGSMSTTLAEHLYQVDAASAATLAKIATSKVTRRLSPR